MTNRTALFDSTDAQLFYAEDKPFSVGDLLRLKFLPNGDLLQEDWRIAALLEHEDFRDAEWKTDVTGVVTRVNEDSQFEVWVTVYRRPFSLDSVYELVFQSDSFEWE